MDALPLTNQIPERNLIWRSRKPNGYEQSSRLRALHQLQSDNSNNIDSTAKAVGDIFTMTVEQQIEGLAAVAFRNDGSHYLIIAGIAVEQNIRASGAVNSLADFLNTLSIE